MSAQYRVVSVGTSIPSEKFVSALRHAGGPMPNGYCMQRPLFSEGDAAATTHKPGSVLFVEDLPEAERATAGAFADVYFTLTVEQNPEQRPLFTITRSDAPETKRYASVDSPQDAWRSALADAIGDFPLREREILPLKKLTSGVGVKLCGLHLVEVRARTEALPGADAPAVQAALQSLKASTAGGEDGAKKGAAARKSPPSSQGRKKSAAVDVSTPVIADSPLKSRKRTRSAAAETKKTEAATDGESMETAAPKTKRAKKEPAKGRGKKAEAAPAAAASSSAPPLVCPDCGLAGQPFCAATGKAHPVVSACEVCGLTSAFCPKTGKLHPGVAAAGNVSLPKPARKRAPAGSRKKTAAGTAGDSADVQEVTVVNSQTTEAKPKAKRVGKKKKDAGAETTTAATEKTDAGPSLLTLLELKKASEDESSVASVAPQKPPEYEYPALRPPLPASEHHKAAAALLNTLKEKEQQSPDGVMPALGASLPFQMRLVKRPTVRSAGGAKAKAVKSRRKNGDGTEEAEDDDDAEHNNENSNGTNGGEHVQRSEMVHPLSVHGVGSSVAGKRLVKFLSEYASERWVSEAARRGAAAKTGGAREAAAAEEGTPSKKKPEKEATTEQPQAEAEPRETDLPAVPDEPRAD